MRFKLRFLPEAADELLIADVAVAIDIVVAHQRLQFDLLGEDSTTLKHSRYSK